MPKPPTFDEIKARANYCTWHTVHGPQDIQTLLKLLERAQKASEGHKKDAKKHHERLEQVQADHAAGVREKKRLVEQADTLQGQLDILNGAQTEVGHLREVLDHIREAADYPK